MAYAQHTRTLATPLGELSIQILDSFIITVDCTPITWQYNHYVFHCRMSRHSKTLEWSVIDLSVLNMEFLSVKPIIKNGIMSAVRPELDKFLQENEALLVSAEYMYRKQNYQSLQGELSSARKKLLDLENDVDIAKQKMEKAELMMLREKANVQ